jgi:hypothetical protein
MPYSRSWDADSRIEFVRLVHTDRVVRSRAGDTVAVLGARLTDLGRAWRARGELLAVRRVCAIDEAIGVMVDVVVANDLRRDCTNPGGQPKVRARVTIDGSAVRVSSTRLEANPVDRQIQAGVADVASVASMAFSLPRPRAICHPERCFHVLLKAWNVLPRVAPTGPRTKAQELNIRSVAKPGADGRRRLPTAGNRLPLLV